MFLRLALKSLLNRKGSVALTLIAISISVLVLLGIEHIRHQAKENFSNTVSGVDLIVGARTGSLNLLLYTVFRIGNPTNNIQWQTFKEISQSKHVKWALPISLGDSHKGYRVMGTSADYFQHFRYANKRELAFSEGRAFSGIYDVVLGAEVARKLGYSLGKKLIISHGLVSTHFSDHKDSPFKVVGILEPTGTPVDQTLHVSLEGLEAVHSSGVYGVISSSSLSSNNTKDLKKENLTPKSITAVMVGLKSRVTTFRVQRELNQHKKEPLTAILPGVTLSELWQMMSVMENVLRLISILILCASLLGLSAMLLASIREREHEIAILRTIGASPWFVFFLVEAEAILITLFAILMAVGLLVFSIFLLSPVLTQDFGLFITPNIWYQSNLYLLGTVLLSSFIIGAIPAVAAYVKAAINPSFS